MHKLVKEKLKESLDNLKEGLGKKFNSDSDNKYKNVLLELASLRHLPDDHADFAQYQDVFYHIREKLNYDDSFNDIISDLCFLLTGESFIYKDAGDDARAVDPEEIYHQLIGEMQ